MNDNELKNNEDRNNGGDNQKGKGGPRIGMFLIVALMCIFIITAISNLFRSSTTQEVSFNEFLEMVENGEVTEVRLSDTTIEISSTEKDTSPLALYGFSTGMTTVTRYTGYVEYPELVQILLDADVQIYQEIPNAASMLISILVSYVLPIAIVWIFFMFIMRRNGGGIMGVGKSNAKMYVQKETGVTFRDVAGQEEAKESLMEIVDFLHDPEKYTRIGAKLPKGALLVGPPGTGKTLLARAVAGEAKVPFFSLSGSSFVEMFVGVGASRVRDLFKQAQQQAPCIVFIDEIDAIGKSRDTRFGGNDEREQTLNQLLAEMDGFDSSKGVVILAATNRPEVLDKALLRPGRLDRRIIVDKPDLKGRIDTLKVHAKGVKMDDTVDFETIALATSGAVGSDLANIVNEAAITAVKKKRDFVTQEDMFEAVELVLVGKEKKDRIMSEKERSIVSYHEVGHALVSALQKETEPVQKITIVPRTMGALGYVLNVPEEEKYLNSEEELRAMIVEYMGGRAAEEVVFHSVTTGAANDIERATKLARSMVTQYGMSEEFGLMSLESVESVYLDGKSVTNCADETAAMIDEVVKRMLKESYEKAKGILSENREELDEIAAFLIKKESITGEEFMKILNEIRGRKGLAPLGKKKDEKADAVSEAAAPGMSGAAEMPAAPEAPQSEA